MPTCSGPILDKHVFIHFSLLNKVEKKSKKCIIDLANKNENEPYFLIGKLLAEEVKRISGFWRNEKEESN